ncbi:hypothetical protein E4U09_000363 [Claviceps aff. purpurea]|uniref:Uncharacterized protein n=1 Tax=Claviceps aff. purpurea TaxID=1967640 RepID=A0A9P7U4B4_9HYPO|nr:hypothetical protein E4U09_000363 [Claviceps aff. purpurea]
MAGYSPPRSRGDDDSNNCTGRYQQSPQQTRIATYLDQTVDDWKTINGQQEIDTPYLPDVNRSFVPGIIGHYFQVQLPMGRWLLQHPAQRLSALPAKR